MDPLHKKLKLGTLVVIYVY